MRRSLARCAIAFTSASVGRRNVSRSVSRTQLLASRKTGVGIGMSCNMSAPDCENAQNKKGRPVSRLPLEPFSTPPVQQDPADLGCVHRLFGRFRHRNYRYESAAIGFCTELDMTFDLGKESMVGAHADIKAGMPGGAALTRDDVAGNHVLTAIGLDAQALAR